MPNAKYNLIRLGIFFFFFFWNFLVPRRKRQRHGWLTKDSQDKNSQKYDCPWALSSHACAWPWSLSEWWNQHYSPLLCTLRIFCCSCILSAHWRVKRACSSLWAKKEAGFVFQVLFNLGFGTGWGEFVEQKSEPIIPEGGETVITKVQFQLQLMVIYRMESQNCLHLFSKVIFAQSRKLRCFFVQQVFAYVFYAYLHNPTQGYNRIGQALTILTVWITYKETEVQTTVTLVLLRTVYFWFEGSSFNEFETKLSNRELWASIFFLKIYRWP